MDKLDWAILKELQENARKTFVDIGKSVGLSAPAVAERIEKLQDENIIRRFTIDLDHEKLGYLLKAIINFKVNQGQLHQFLKFVNTLKEVQECLRITGMNCVMMKVMVRTPGELEQLINKLYQYGEPNTSLVLSNHKDFKSLEE